MEIIDNSKAIPYNPIHAAGYALGSQEEESREVESDH